MFDVNNHFISLTYKVTANRKPLLQNASLLDKNDTPTQGYFCVLFSTFF